MKNNFAQEYAREEEIRAAYNTAKETGNKVGIEMAKDDMMSLIDEIGAKGDAYAFVYRLYKEMKEAGNEHIDLHDWIRDETRILGMLKECGIKSFTFSSGWSSAVESAWLFQQNGCRLEGLIELNSKYKDLEGNREKAHGYLFSIQ